MQITFDDEEAYEMFLILDSFARIRKGKEPSVNYLRERLLPAYREWHAANPFKARPRPSFSNGERGNG